MSFAILICALVLIACIISNKFSNKIGVPVLPLFIILGMLMGSDGIFGIEFSDFHLAEQVCSVALIFIMFYGGFGTNWKIAKPVAVQSVLLSTLGVVVTSVLAGLFCHLVLKTSLLEGLLIGSVIGSTDAASVFSILRSKKLNLKHNLASLLEIESGSNDPTAYMMTMIFLSLMSAQKTGTFVWMILAQIGFGLLFGFGVAILSVWVLKRLNFENSGIQAIFVVAIALAAYALPSVLGGNGYLSVYITGIVLGNSRIRQKVELVHFFDGLTWMMQIALFFVIGLLSFPSQIPQVIVPSLLIALFLTFVARPAAIFLILTPFRTPLKHQLLVAWSGLRGAASIVFAIYAVVSPAYTKTDIFHIVFCVALLSVSMQGTLLPVFARKLGLVDNEETVMKTFNDYQDDRDLSLIEIPMEEGHQWCGMTLREIHLPQNMVVLMIRRDGKTILPKGTTKVRSQDVLVLGGAPYREDGTVLLTEEEVGEDHPWAGQNIQDIAFPSQRMIAVIRRGNQVIIPSGGTTLLTGDLLILSSAPQEEPEPLSLNG
ncbi:potassium/proton antiporter [Fumia xinanensis]|uniref:Potassium/proton antiporter n=1 Tax=Fumia xinanensis TaxID=2763659 RepID=A0A926I7M4_9FIRM|nr:potassium/proton antiporter [Fumia xinanensis]MBC8560012.1 potassium/proton antiporter [Fumia xinanensis]